MWGDWTYFYTLYPGKRAEGSYCAGGYSFGQVTALPSSLPIVTVRVGARPVGVKALVDTGCSVTILASHLVSISSGASVVVAFDGRKVECQGTTDVELWVSDRPVKVRAVVADKVVNGIDVVMGMNVIFQMIRRMNQMIFYET